MCTENNRDSTCGIHRLYCCREKANDSLSEALTCVSALQAEAYTKDRELAELRLTVTKLGTDLATREQEVRRRGWRMADKDREIARLYRAARTASAAMVEQVKLTSASEDRVSILQERVRSLERWMQLDLGEIARLHDSQRGSGTVEQVRTGEIRLDDATRKIKRLKEEAQALRDQREAARLGQEEEVATLKDEVKELKELVETKKREIVIAINILRAERNMRETAQNGLFGEALEKALGTELRATVDDAKVKT